MSSTVTDPAVLVIARTFDQLEAWLTEPPERIEPAAMITAAGVSRIAKIDLDEPRVFAYLDNLGSDASELDHRYGPELVAQLLAQRAKLPKSKLASRLLDGLLPLLLRPCRTDKQRPRSGTSATRDTDRHQTRDPGNAWLLAVRLAQVAVWLAENAPTDPMARELLPRARETRFLLASAPLRALDVVQDGGSCEVEVRWDGAMLASYVGSWQEASARRKEALARRKEASAGRKEAPATLNEGGRDPWTDYGELAWQSRADWLDCLDTFERHPALFADGPAQLDARLGWLVFPLGRPPRSPLAGMVRAMTSDRLLRLTPPVGDARVATRRRAQEEQLHLHVASDHLLPRYRLDEAFGLLLQMIRDRQDGRLARWVAAVVPTAMLVIPFLLGLLALVVTPILALGDVAVDVVRGTPIGAWLGTPSALTVLEVVSRTVAVGWIGALVITLGLGRRAGSYLGLLRIPAATAFGLAIVSSLGPGWGQAAGSRGGSVALLLIVLAFGYLGVEVLNQGADERASSTLLRVLLLGSIGLGVATMVTVLVLWLIAPVFLPELTAQTTSVLVTARLVVTIAAASFALGVFLQAIWDESPVTAPLSRVRLR